MSCKPNCQSKALNKNGFKSPNLNLTQKSLQRPNNRGGPDKPPPSPAVYRDYPALPGRVKSENLNLFSESDLTEYKMN